MENCKVEKCFTIDLSRVKMSRNLFDLKDISIYISRRGVELNNHPQNLTILGWKRQLKTNNLYCEENILKL